MSAFLPNLDLSKIHKAHKVRPSRSAESKFPCKLFRLLLDVEEKCLSHIISFHPSGTCFRVHDPTSFEQEIMPVYFKPGKYRSFQRQLNLYGFQRFTALKPFWESCYRHPAFTLSQKLGCTKIERPMRQRKSASAAGTGSVGDKTNDYPRSSSSSLPPPPTYLPATLPPSHVPSSSAFLPSHDKTNCGLNEDDDKWLGQQSSQEQMMADAAAAKWRRLGRMHKEQVQVTDHTVPTKLVKGGVPTPTPTSTYFPLPSLMFGASREELHPPEPIQNHHNMLSSLSALQQDENNIPQNDPKEIIPAFDLSEPVWLAEDVNLCHEIMGQDCDLCKDGNKLVDDFFRQRGQNNI